jgi:hypothetical protein
MMTIRSVFVAAVLVSSLACGQTPKEDANPIVAISSSPPTQAPVDSDAARSSASPQPERSMMRFDFVLTSTEPGKPPTSSTYTLNLEEGVSGEIRVGENVPLQSPPSHAPGTAGSASLSMGAVRMDVGTKLKASFTPSQSGFVLHSDFENSAVDPNPMPNQAVPIRKISLRGDALVSLGKSSLIASSEDPISHRKYELGATATKLR